MFNHYVKKWLSKGIFAASMLFATLAWAQSAVVSPTALPPGDIVNGTYYNTIYGFKVEVGDYNISLQNLTVNFAGTFPGGTPEVRTVSYRNYGAPIDPSDDEDSGYNFGSLSTTGGVNIASGWNYTLYAGETYYFYIQTNFNDASAVGSTISATLPSLDAIEFSSSGPVAVTGSIANGNSHTVVNPTFIVTPLPLPTKSIPVGSYYPILGYKIEAPDNVLSSVIQSDIITTISGTYTSSTDGINLQYYYSDSPVFDSYNDDSYSYNASLNSNTGGEEIETEVYSERYVYKGKPKYVFLVAYADYAVTGHTISATLNPSMFTPSVAGAVFSGGTYTFTNPVPTLTVPSALNTAGIAPGLYSYGNLYTFAITAPANSDFILKTIDVSISGVHNALNQFSNSSIYFIFYKGQPNPITATTYFDGLGNYDSKWDYYSFSSDTVEIKTLYAYNNGDIIPAGQTRYFTIGSYNYGPVANNSIQFLSINAINGTTFAGMSGAGGVKTTEATATFQTVNTTAGTSISPYGENLVYEFDGYTNTYYYTYLTNLVVTLTGTVDPANIASVKLKYNNYNNFNAPFTNANNIATVWNPTSKVITFSSINNGYMYYYYGKSKFFVTVELNTPLVPTVTGQTIGIAAIDQSTIGVYNSYTSPATVLGSSFQAGAAYTYTLPAITFTGLAIPGNTIGVNQSVTPIYTAKVEASGNAEIASLNFTTSGTYTSNDIVGFALYGGSSPMMDYNNGSVSYAYSNSTGSGEALSFSIGDVIPKGINYVFIVPEVANTTATGSTVKIEATPTSAIVFANTLIGVSSTLPAGNTFTIIVPSVTFTGIPGGGTTIAKYGYTKAYTVEVNATAAFTLQDFAFTTNGRYNSSGIDGFYTYFSSAMMSNTNDDATVFNSYGDNSNLSVLTTTGETIHINNGYSINQTIPPGKSYITIFIEAQDIFKQSFGVAGIETSITTLVGGYAITYLNNVAGWPSTVVGQVLTLTSIATGKDTIYRANNQVLYAQKYMSNVDDQFSYFGMWLYGGSFVDTDFKTNAASSLNVWMSTLPGFSPATAVRISDPANGATSINYSGSWYEFNNYIVQLKAHTPYYFFATVDVSPSAAIGHVFQAYGEDQGEFDNEFEVEPYSNNYQIDRFASFMDRGRAKVIVGETNPLITFSGATLTVGGAALDLSTLFVTNSTGTVSYSITGTAASLSGSILTAVAAGEVTVTATISPAPGFNAGSQQATFTVATATAVTAASLNASIVIYPNPSTGQVKIIGDFDSATVSDIVGTTILSTTKSALDLSAVSEGLYFVKVTKGAASVVKKIVITK